MSWEHIVGVMLLCSMFDINDVIIIIIKLYYRLAVTFVIAQVALVLSNLDKPMFIFSMLW